MTKPNKDGWIRHRGGNFPSNVTDRIDVRFRDGEIGVFRCPITLKWVHEHEEYDIMAWRPHKPDIEALIQEGIDSADAGKLTPIEHVRAKWERSSISEMPAAKYFDGPIQWRDRIRELDEQREEVCALYNRQVAEIKEERTSLVAKLKAEGFALIQSDEPNGELESAQDDIEQQDMSDWRKWEKGDILLCVKADCYPSELTVGKLYPYNGYGDVIDDGGAEQGYPIRFGECFKWHSRPPQ